jgi:hypothetical protein
VYVMMSRFSCKFAFVTMELKCQQNLHDLTIATQLKMFQFKTDSVCISGVNESIVVN